MEIGGRLDRSEEITENLARETEVTWGNCDKELSPADFVAKVKKVQPKSNVRWIEGHFYSGTFDDGVDTFSGVCFCSNREDGGGLVLLSSSAPDDTATRTFYYPESLESTENIKDITEEVSRLWK